MKKFIVNVFATTGISLVLLSITALFFQAECMYLKTVFQVLGTNAAVHSALFILSRLETKHPLFYRAEHIRYGIFWYAMIEIFLHIALITILLIAAGAVFHWFTSTPIWVLILMGFAVYMISSLLNLFCMKQEADKINALIQKRNRKKGQ